MNFDKIQKLMPDFACKWTAEKGAAQMHRMFEAIGMDAEVFRSEPYTRLKMLMSLKARNLLDENLFWSGVARDL